ncbi:MAG TPA: glycoside hydrolase family 88 protein [Opitutaceae bacterium]
MHPLPSTLLLSAALALVPASEGAGEARDLDAAIAHSLATARTQSLGMAKALASQPGRLSKTIGSDGTLETCDSSWWVSGFFPGVLWYLYENFGEEQLKQQAIVYTLSVEDQKYTTDNHDVGFMIFCSFGNAYRLTQNSEFKEVIRIASESLSTRFSAVTGTIRSWDLTSWSEQWKYPVIIDNMMNLEMLMWAGREFGNDAFKNIAIRHADTTMRNHFREDFSSFHVVSYDLETGEVEKKTTAQGYSDDSAWTRGQGWGLYGYTMMYRLVREPKYLDQAIGIAEFITNHPRLPEDKIPYWDFDAPDIPDAPRDASAGALICSALFELSQYVDAARSEKYKRVAEKQIRTLSTPEYLAEPGENQHFILKHSVGHMPNGTEIDVPLTYADYYFVEAMLRWKALKRDGKLSL